MKEKLVGVNSIMEALQGRRKVEKIYVLEGRPGKRLQDLLRLAEKKGVFIQELPRQRLNQMSPGVNHQGVLATVEDYPYASLEEVLEAAALRGEEPFLLILDGIEDPQNLGSIIRSAECAGVHGIILPRHGGAPVSEAVSRASAGAVEHMLVVQETNLVQAIKKLKDAGLWVVGADMDSEQEYYHTAIPTPTALVIGSEGEGMRRLVKEHCDLLVKIPMQGQIASLNAGVATALILYEILRQRGTP